MDPHRRELERLLRDLLLLLSGNPALANHLLSALRDDLVVPRPAIRVGRVTNVGGLSVCAMAWIISTPKGATISKDEGYPTSRFTMLLSMYQACSMGSIGSSACVLARGPSMGMGLQAPAGREREKDSDEIETTQRSRSHGQTSQESRAPAVEEGSGISPAGSRREHLLQVQVDHWRPPPGSSSQVTEG